MKKTLIKVSCLGILVLSDIVVFFAAFLLGYGLREFVFPAVFGLAAKPVPLTLYLRAGGPLGVLVIVIIFSSQNLYTKRFTFWEETRRLLKAITLAFILIMTVVFASRSYPSFSRISLFSAWAASLVIYPLVRSALKRMMAGNPMCRKNVLILGRGGTAVQTAREIRKEKELGYHVVGYLPPAGDERGDPSSDVARIPGGFDDLEAICSSLNIQDIIIVPMDYSRKDFFRLIKRCESLAETLKIIPMTDGLYSMGVEIESLEDLSFITVPTRLLKPWNLVIKRAMDIFLALICCVALSPFLLVFVAAILVDSRGAVFYCQERIGRHGKPFRIFKFRSMFLNAEERLQVLLEKDPAVRAEWTEYQKIRGNDPRVTRVGRFLRKWSLDELPQLFNVLRGDMSLMGPRPYLPREKEKIGERGDFILKVKPGITGLWQVGGRNLLKFADRLHLDEYYIRNWSLWLDIIILIKTVKVLARREGAF